MDSRERIYFSIMKTGCYRLSGDHDKGMCLQSFLQSVPMSQSTQDKSVKTDGRTVDPVVAKTPENPIVNASPIVNADRIGGASPIIGGSPIEQPRKNSRNTCRQAVRPWYRPVLARYI